MRARQRFTAIAMPSAAPRGEPGGAQPAFVSEGAGAARFLDSDLPVSIHCTRQSLERRSNLKYAAAIYETMTCKNHDTHDAVLVRTVHRSGCVPQRLCSGPRAGDPEWHGVTLPGHAAGRPRRVFLSILCRICHCQRPIWQNTKKILRNWPIDIPDRSLSDSHAHSRFLGYS